MTSTAQAKVPACLICGVPLSIRPATGRKSGKSFIFMVCPKDGRHFRAFIADQSYVQRVVERGLQ